MPNRAQHWQLNPEVDFLNHGSFGAMPKVVRNAQRDWIDRLERDPIEFLAPERLLLPKLDIVRSSVARLVHAEANDLAFVRNATEGVNAVLRSFPFVPGDEVVITNHGYNACNNTVRYAAGRVGANVAVAKIPFPIRSRDQVIDAVDSTLTPKTRLILIDHVTSPTGLILPIQEIIDLAHRRNVRVMVDGAHAPGMIPVDLGALDADYYTANHHKWLCGPKSSGFLYVRPEYQGEVRPTVISHGANKETYGASRFLAEFNWIGTYDPTPLLSVPTAIEFLEGLSPGGVESLMRENRELVLSGRAALLAALHIGAPSPESMIGTLASVPLAGENVGSASRFETLQQRLFTRHRIEVPVFQFDGRLRCLRISAQAYNCLDQYERLAEALRTELE